MVPRLMDERKLSELHRLSIKAAKKAGQVLLRMYGRHGGVEVKDGAIASIVTEADKKADLECIRALSKGKIPIITEETPSRSGVPDGFSYLVDPLDGTINYAMHNPFFCVSIGIAFDGLPVAGTIYNPITKEIFTAIAGKGAFLNGKRIYVSKNTDLSKTPVTFGYGYEKWMKKFAISKYWEVSENARHYFCPGALALQLCYVAAGRNDCFFTNGYGGPWDVCAGIIIAKEAGAIVGDFSGKEWKIGEPQVLCANSKEIFSKTSRILAKSELQSLERSTNNI